MKLTPAERLIYSKLLEIELLLKKDRDNEETIEALRFGYPDFYGLEFIYEEMSENDTTYVHDVFQMYDLIQRALGHDDGMPDEAKFPGFDGNNETNLVGFAGFLLSRGQWTQVIGALKDFPNSHGLQRDYRGMLARFREITSGDHGFELSVVEANELTDPKWVILQTDW
jgi:hypothetical protein